MNKIFRWRVTVIISVMTAAVIAGIASCKSDHNQNNPGQTAIKTCDSLSCNVDSVHYSRPETIEVKELQGCKFSEFDTVFGKYVYDNYNHIYLTDWFNGQRHGRYNNRRKALNGIEYVRDMKLNQLDTVRILMAKYTGFITRKYNLTRFVFKGLIDSVLFIEPERHTLMGYYDVNDKRFVYRVMHLRRSVPYRLLMHDSLDKLPRRFWKPLVPGEGDAFALKLYIDNEIIRRAEVTHFYDVLVDSAFECPDDRRKDAAHGNYDFPEGSPEWEYLNKYEPGEKEYLDSLYRNGYHGCLNSIFIADTIN